MRFLLVAQGGIFLLVFHTSALSADCLGARRLLAAQRNASSGVLAAQKCVFLVAPEYCEVCWLPKTAFVFLILLAVSECFFMLAAESTAVSAWCVGTNCCTGH